jgi:hypothetical protein
MNFEKAERSLWDRSAFSFSPKSATMRYVICL